MKENSNVLPFQRKSDLIHFRVESVRVELWKNNRDITSEIRKHSIIVLRNIKNGRFCVHPLTDFIFHHWKYKAFNTQRLHATYISSFLNFLKNEYDIPSLQDLEFFHGTAFLNNLTKRKNSRTTFQKAERTLTLFYEYLAKKNLLHNIDKEQFTINNLFHNSKQQYTLSPFTGVIRPGKKQGHIAHDLPEEYILPFLEAAVRESNPIALGIYMQFFGGLRLGELVNIKRTDISSIGAYGEYGLVIKLIENNMRTDIKDSVGSSHVKKERSQIVFPIADWLKVLYTNHLKKYIPKDESSALFVNRDGNAMSGQSYRNYFDKLKKAFLNQLRESNNPTDIIYAVKLEELKWSTHLGRGVFTNLLAEEADNPYDIALPRGDSNLSSAMVYQGNTERMKMKIENRMQYLYNDFLPKLSK